MVETAMGVTPLTRLGKQGELDTVVGAYVKEWGLTPTSETPTLPPAEWTEIALPEGGYGLVKNPRMRRRVAHLMGGLAIVLALGVAFLGVQGVQLGGGARSLGPLRLRFGFRDARTSLEPNAHGVALGAQANRLSETDGHSGGDLAGVRRADVDVQPGERRRCVVYTRGTERVFPHESRRSFGIEAKNAGECATR